MDTHSAVIWVCLIAYSIHIMEEFMLDWKTWAETILKLPANWPHFYVTNMIVFALGVASGMIGWDIPAVSLAFPALMLINATFFHVFPILKTRVFSPGIITSILLFYPIGIWAFVDADSAGVLTTQTLILSFLIGAAYMASPIVFLKMAARK